MYQTAQTADSFRLWILRQEKAMQRRVRLVGVVVLTALLGPWSAWAQYPSDLVGFNGPPINDPAT